MKSLLLGFVSVVALIAATESAHAVRRNQVVVAPQAVVLRQRVPLLPRRRVVVRQQVAVPQPVLFVPQSFGFQAIQSPVFNRGQVVAPCTHFRF